jgi:glutamine synthetase adenylyltransferase
MKEVIEELNKKFNEYCNLEQDYQKAMDALAKLEFNNKTNVIDDIRQRRNEADEKMKEYYNAVIALRKVCTHMLPNNFSAFVSAGKSDEYTIEVCSICGTELRRINVRES